MKSIVLLSSLVIIVSATTALPQGAAVIVKQKARGVAGQPQSQRPLTGSGATSTTARPRAASPAALSASQEAAKKIYIDLVVIKSRSAVTDEMKERLAANMTAAAAGGKADAAAIRKLAENLATTVNKHKIGSTQIKQLSDQLFQMLAGNGLTAKGAEAGLQKLQDTLVIGGVPMAEAKAVTTELGAIVATAADK